MEVFSGTDFVRLQYMHGIHLTSPTRTSLYSILSIECWNVGLYLHGPDDATTLHGTSLQEQVKAWSEAVVGEAWASDDLWEASTWGV